MLLPLFCLLVIHECKKEYHYICDHVISWSYQASVGLDYIHKKNILHRDIKPSKSAERERERERERPYNDLLVDKNVVCHPSCFFPYEALRMSVMYTLGICLLVFFL